MPNYSELQARVESLQIQLPELEHDSSLAIRYVANGDNGSAVGKAGRALELILKALHKERHGDPGEGLTIEQLLSRVGAYLPPTIKQHIQGIQRFRNMGVHARSDPITQTDADVILFALIAVIEWWVARDGLPPTYKSSQAYPTADAGGRRSSTIAAVLAVILVVGSLSLATYLVVLLRADPDSSEPTPTFDSFETADADYMLIAGEEAKLKLLGQNLDVSFDSWFPVWCAELEREGLLGACAAPRSMAQDGTSLSLTVDVPEGFMAEELQLPDGGPRAAISLGFRLRFIFVTYEDSSEYAPVFMQIWESIKAEDPRFSPEPFIFYVSQNEPEVLAQMLESGRWDGARLSPYVYTKVRSKLMSDEGNEPIEMLICGKRRDNGILMGAYHSIGFARKGQFKSAADNRVPDPRALRDEINQMLARGEKVQFYWGNPNSTSGYIIPCLTWGDMLSTPGLDSVPGGATSVVVSDVMAAGQSEIRVGFGFDSEVEKWMRDTGQEFDLLWRSGPLPLGGLGLLSKATEVKKAAIRRHAQAWIDDLDDPSNGKPAVPLEVLDGFGACVPTLYDDLIRRLETTGENVCGIE